MIYNCFSKNDAVLGTIYRTANGFMSDPIGFDCITHPSHKILNFDCTDLVPGHMQWKEHFGDIVEQLNA